MLYPQNGDGIVITDAVTSFRPMCTDKTENITVVFAMCREQCNRCVLPLFIFVISFILFLVSVLNCFVFIAAVYHVYLICTRLQNVSIWKHKK